MLKYHHEAYQRTLAIMSDKDLMPLYARTAGEHPILARLIAEEIVRRDIARRPQFASSDMRESEFAAAA